MNGLTLLGLLGMAWLAVSLVRANGKLNRLLSAVEGADQRARAAAPPAERRLRIVDGGDDR